MNLYALFEKPSDLVVYDEALDSIPAVAWDQLENNYPELMKREHMWLTDPSMAFMYARFVLQDQWPEAEPMIAQDPYWAYQYALRVLKGAFPEAEPAIARAPHHSFFYAKAVLQAPFPLGEPAIAKDPDFSEGYLKEFPQRRDAIQKLRLSRLR